VGENIDRTRRWRVSEGDVLDGMEIRNRLRGKLSNDLSVLYNTQYNTLRMWDSTSSEFSKKGFGEPGGHS
jgi:hypothetical protein